MSANRLAAYVFGGVYLLTAVLGFVIVGGDVGFVDTQGKSVLGLEVNHLHNVVHLLVGAALLYGATRGTEMARKVNLAVGGTYLLVGIVGLLLDKESDVNILALNAADDGLHLVTAAVLLGVALAMDKARRTTHV
jgi:hypothetical protein